MNETETALSPTAWGEPGRLGMYTAMSGAFGALAVPWLPGTLLRRVRGALVHDIAQSQGLVLLIDAREALAEPSLTHGKATLLHEALRYSATRLALRVAPLAGVLPPVFSAASTFALGRLFARYVQRWRTATAVRIDLDEARSARSAIDRALFDALRFGRKLSARERARSEEDWRDPSTQVTDALIIGFAGLPSWFVRRLDAAFDEEMGKVSRGKGVPSPSATA